MSEMTSHEAKEFLKNIILEKQGEYITAKGFYAELLGYHCHALHYAIKAIDTVEKYKDAYNKGYKDGAEAVAFHEELLRKEADETDQHI